jgi:hypothetical protein
MESTRRVIKPKKVIRFTDKLVNKCPVRRASDIPQIKRHIKWAKALVQKSQTKNPRSYRRVVSLDAHSKISSPKRSDKPKSILKSNVSSSDLSNSIKVPRGVCTSHSRNRSNLATKSRFLSERRDSHRASLMFSRSPQLDESKCF